MKNEVRAADKVAVSGRWGQPSRGRARRVCLVCRSPSVRRCWLVPSTVCRSCCATLHFRCQPPVAVQGQLARLIVDAVVHTPESVRCALLTRPTYPVSTIHSLRAHAEPPSAYLQPANLMTPSQKYTRHRQYGQYRRQSARRFRITRTTPHAAPLDTTRCSTAPFVRPASLDWCALLLPNYILRCLDVLTHHVAEISVAWSMDSTCGSSS